MKLIRTILLIMLAFMVTLPFTMGKAEYAKKEGKACTFCHAKVESKDAMAKNLTDAGKYYKDHNHSLEGYKAPEKK